MSLLDTVEPASWKRTRISNGEVEYFTERDWKHENLFEWEPLYSRETVESLLSQCRLRAGRVVDEYNKGFNSAWELMDKRLRHVHSSNVPWAPYEQWLRSIDASIAALSDLPEADKEKS